MASIKKEIDKAWKMYNRWRNQKIVSPALKKQVMFTRQGWEHITGRDDKKRTLADIYRRLKLLPHAKTIISKMPLVQNKRKRGQNTFYALEAVIQIKQSERLIDRKIRVVLKEDKIGFVRFFSIMDKKQKK